MRRLVLAVLLVCSAVAGARSQPALPSGSFVAPAQSCQAAIRRAEQAHAIPAALLAAIGRVESGRPDPVSGAVVPWPWTINAEGEGRFFPTKAEAIAAVRRLQQDGVQSIDVGCMQVNLLHHPDAFADLAQAFDPVANADYAARFLRSLFAQTNDWAVAAAHYHSATPDLAAGYQRRVMAAWPAEMRQAASPLATAWGATLSRGTVTRPRFGGPGQILPLAGTPSSQASAGRGLDFYRARPILPVRTASLSGPMR